MAIGTTSNMEWLSGPGGGSVEYTAGHGIVIDNYDHIISTDQSVVQDKLTAGDNITIVNNVISAADQVQSDWNQTDSSSVDYIKNKPTLPTRDQLLPAATSADEDKVLTVDSNGDPVWANPQTTQQVQSDWAETDSTDVSFIKNKPQNLVQDASYVHTDNNFTTTDKNKLDGIEAGAEVNVQSDWNVSDTTSDAFIRNKPTIPSGNQLLPPATSVDEDKVLTIDNNGDPQWETPQTFTQQQADWTQTNTQAVDFILHKPTLATVATSGSYNDLSDQPTIPSGNQLLPPATSSDEDKVLMVDSNGDPVWDNPTAFTQQQSDWTQTDNQAVNYIKHKPGAKPVLAGPGIQITETSNDITISTTTLSGISEIKYVQSLPSNPVSGVLYLIPLT